MLKGIPVSPGIVIGKAFILDPEDIKIPRTTIEEADIPKEIARFEDALTRTRAQILEIQERIGREMGAEHSDIFTAHVLVLEDRMLIEEVIRDLKTKRQAVEHIFMEVLKRYGNAFSKIDDEYLRERVSDIQDVGKRVLHNLIGSERFNLANLNDEVVVFAYDLSPSDTATMHRERVVGFATDIGGRTSHTAIMARSLEIPAVVGLGDATQKVQSDDPVIVDGNHGLVIIQPDAPTLEKYIRARGRFEDFVRTLDKFKELPARTTDGHEVTLAANIELPDEIPHCISHGAQGIGLYRTEYFYMNRVDLPSEDEHFEAYRNVAEKVKPHPVIIRTLDLGGDKFLSSLEVPREMNPFLGWRAIRFCLARPDIFKVQLRAILRAAVHGKLKLMYPMISGLEELRQANQILSEAKEALRREGKEFDEHIEVGAMIEIPSAALTADVLAKESAFFSIGSNDLIQYSLAVDRVNEKIAYLYEPAHPAILKLIKNVIDAGHRNKIWVGMCGEMGGDPVLAVILLGLGLDEYSMSPVIIPEIKKVIRSISLKEAQEIALKSLELTTGAQIRSFVRERIKHILPEVLGEEG
ncbi:MAG: phosphoenolpyruvate--protein phosphotransferase [Candidatus Omnitrophica bacterium]|nr:phosphoenolpyruvate--protein phosphotransferase [Candidatus Omnitrophota bacterium]